MPLVPVMVLLGESRCRVYILVSNCGLEDWPKQYSILQNMKHEIISG